MGYPGPPPSTPPPAGWRPALVVRPAPPRRLPAQDHAALDAAERAARRLTWAVAAGAGVLAVLVACVLGSQALL
jgi:hypothetical protein